MSKNVQTHTSRIFIDADLNVGHKAAASPEQAHYLKNVMRLGAGDALRVFNGRDGEWSGEVCPESGGKPSKHGITISIREQLRPQTTEPDLWLCAAPIKKAHLDYMIEKAAELGIRAMHPILTARTQIREVNTERAHAIAIEAAEQSERMSVPVFKKPVTLKDLVAKWPEDRALIVCAEWGDALPVQQAFALPQIKSAEKAAIVTGPEGGFADDELAMLKQVKGAIFIRLGPRILRADTAAIAALSCWQSCCGDWRDA